MRATLRTTCLLLLLSMCSSSEEGTSAAVSSKPPGTDTVVTSVGSNAPTAGSTAATTTADRTLVTPAQTSATVTSNAPTSTNKATQKPTPTAAEVTITTAAETTRPGPPQPTTTGVNTTPAPPAGVTTVLSSSEMTVGKPQTTRQTPVPASSSPRAPTVQVLRTTQSFTVPPSNDNQRSTANTPTNTPTVQRMSEKSTVSALPGSQDPAKGVMTVTITTQGLTSTQAMNAGIPEVTSTTAIQAKTKPTPVRTTAGTTLQKITTITPVQPRKFTYPLLSGQETKEEKDLVEVCQKLMPDWKNVSCTLTWRLHNGSVQFDGVEINGHVDPSLAKKYYEEIPRAEPTPNPTNYNTLIAILASCGALLIMIIILTVCASHHRKPGNENQQYLTEELHTVENYYHDNPTLEVMEVQPEMQEKKMVLNGEFNDSWIVPIDNLMKEDLPDEEDTHL